MNRLLKSPLWWCAIVLLGMTVAGHAQSAIYQNLAPNYYSVGGQNPQPPPTIDATAFDNESTFSVSFNAYNPNVELFETEDTLFFTNNNTMIANAPINTNGFFFASSVGCGFNFDYYQQSSGLELPADTFYNGGNIRCDSTNDNNNVLDVFGFFNGQFLLIQTSVGELNVSATNIYNPGTVDVGSDGLMNFTGGSADFSRSLLVIEGGISGQAINSLGYIGIDTNAEWNPGLDLGANTAISSFSGFNASGFENIMDLTNSVPYFKLDPTFVGTNETLISRSIFLQDTSANLLQGTSASVQTNVYFDSAAVVGGGFAHVEWLGLYVDPASGATFTNYLYLSDDYALGASTNVFISGGNGNVNSGIPDNFTLTAQPTRALLGLPTTTGFVPYPSLFLSNSYAYFSAQVIPTSVPTNVSLINPHGVLTNLPGRLQITATKSLNLTLANIQGPNYMALVATNQFDGSAGASIDVPYSDIYLGVTNGFLDFSNVISAAIPAWSGTVQGWSTRFIYSTPGVTNDYRIMLVSSELSPITTPQVQNLWLHSTNLVEISDVIDAFGTVFIDSPNLTLSTNGPGNGATALDGELNWESTSTIGLAQLPNLLWLTNNGAIRSLGLINLGGASDVYGAVINNGLIADQGTVVDTTNFVNGGSISNGIGSFVLQAQSTLLTNGNITSSGSVTINTGTLLTSNLWITAGKALNLTSTNQLTDANCTNGNFWSVGSQAPSATAGNYFQNGFNVPFLPTNQTASDLRYTTVTNIAPNNRRINNLWAGLDHGYSVSGYTNNVAVGHMILDASNSTSLFYFSGTGSNGTTNAIYVDEIEFRDWATNRNGSGDLTALSFNTNVVIYYAQAIINGISFATLLNHHNGDHLRWMPAYAGVFSSTNLVYPAGVTNSVNAALAQDSQLDSNGNGNPNNTDPSPTFVPAQVALAANSTNAPPLKMKIQWDSIPASTNFVLYTTNLVTGPWLTLTNFISPTNVPPLNGWPITNVIFDATSPAQQKYYRVLVNPNTLDEFGY